MEIISFKPSICEIISYLCALITLKNRKMKEKIFIELTDDQINKIVESQKPKIIEPITFSITGAAKKIGISKAHIYILINSGEIKKIMIGRSPRIHIDEINKFSL